MSKKLKLLHFEMSRHMDAIKKLFQSGAKITVVVRNPGYGDADVVIGDDDLDETVAAIQRLQKREPQFKQGEVLRD